MEQKNNKMIEREQNNNDGGVVVTDMLANLCTELAVLFRSLSRITQTCLGLKEQLSNSTTSYQQPTTSRIIPEGDCHVKSQSDKSEAVNSKVVNHNN